MASFVDRVVLQVTAGNGGHGVASVKREKFKPLGGPDGGNGGHGGSVVLAVDLNTTTLIDYHHTPHRKADNGRPGAGDERNGGNGEDLVLKVPEGTVVKTREGEILADLVGEGMTFTVAEGGRGGLGNKALASKRRKAPGFALLGEPGESREIILELKSLADVALVGFPSAGKSSLVSVVSAAKPKIADYPFTTLHPNLGVVRVGPEKSFVVADIPGLIEGASEGAGLGHLFLRHLQRTRVLLHVVDLAPFDDTDPVKQARAIVNELKIYDEELYNKPRWLVLNKLDMVPEAERVTRVLEFVRRYGWKGPVFQISALTRQGCEQLVQTIYKHVASMQEHHEEADIRFDVEASLPMAADLMARAGLQYDDDLTSLVKPKQAAARKTVAKKAPAKKAVAQKAPAKKVATKKAAVKTAATPKTAPAKPASKKVAAKQAVSKVAVKTAAKPAVKKAAAKPVAAKKAVAVKPVAVKKAAAPKAAPAKKAAVKTAVVKKAPAKKAAATPVAVKTSAVKKAAAPKAPATKAPAKKVAVKPVAAKTRAAKKAVAKKAAR